MAHPALWYCFLIVSALLLREPPALIANDCALEAEIDRIYAFADDTVKQRLSLLDQSIVDHRFDPAVRRAIGMYVERWRYGSERLLARSAAYFPYFSEQLEARQMPDAIKYLTVTESALRPYALSHVGAAGFWQLMPGTARELGLVVNDTLDERLDLAIGTDAGLEYLLRQYERYGDWALAMAAYNSGPGRVNRAKRRSGSDNYWKLRKYLPRETRTYVPNYIAAAYLMTYFSAHELTPAFMDPDLQLTQIITVYDFLSLHRVAMVTGLNPAKVIELNPAYLSGYIPTSSHGHSLRLPERVLSAMIDYLNNHHDPSEAPALPWLSPRLHNNLPNGKGLYPGSQDTSVHQLSEWFGIAPHQLMIWSGYGPQDSIHQEQPWRYLRPKQILTFKEILRKQLNPVAKLPESPFLLQAPKVVIKRNILPPKKTSDSPPAKEYSKKRPLSGLWNWIKA